MVSPSLELVAVVCTEMARQRRNEGEDEKPGDEGRNERRPGIVCNDRPARDPEGVPEIVDVPRVAEETPGVKATLILRLLFEVLARRAHPRRPSGHTGGRETKTGRLWRDIVKLRFQDDPRIVLTLDAGGTTFEFSAIRGNESLGKSTILPAEANDLGKSLSNIVRGFETIRKQLPAAPAAISFAFPGPADYPRGIVANVGNLPAYRGGVPLGPLLEDRFQIPVFLNNDGDLFAYGEALAGFLPFVNGLLEESGSPRRYRNLVGLTLGTGLGGGAVIDGRLLIGDNSAGCEVWLLRNKLDPDADAEEGASIRAVKRVYAEAAGIPFDHAPEPREIFRIGIGESTEEQQAAREAFRRLGEVSGDVLAQSLTLIDGLSVIGGGMSAAHPLFMPALVEAMNASFRRPSGPMRRLIPRVFDLEDPAQLEHFLKAEVRQLAIPDSERSIPFDPHPRTGVGISRLGTARAVSIGAYAFALDRLDSPEKERQIPGSFFG